jgi:hypothetical protein
MRKNFKGKLKRLLFLIRFALLIAGTAGNIKSKAAKANEFVPLDNKESNKIRLVKNNYPRSNIPSSKPSISNLPSLANRPNPYSVPVQPQRSGINPIGSGLGAKMPAKPVLQRRNPPPRRSPNPGVGGSNPVKKTVSKNTNSKVQEDTIDYQYIEKARKTNEQCSSLLDECQLVVSRIKDSKRLIREAEKACSNLAVQRDLNHLEDEIRKGNLNEYCTKKVDHSTYYKV